MEIQFIQMFESTIVKTSQWFWTQTVQRFSYNENCFYKKLPEKWKTIGNKSSLPNLLVFEASQLSCNFILKLGAHLAHSQFSSIGMNSFQYRIVCKRRRKTENNWSLAGILLYEWILTSECEFCLGIYMVVPRNCRLSVAQRKHI